MYVDTKNTKRKKPDYIKKSIAISIGAIHVQKKLNRLLYKLANEVIDLDTYHYETNKIVNDVDSYDFFEYQEECEKILKADYQRRKRLKERITEMIYQGNTLFLTFTFTDNVLDSTNEKTRRSYVSRFLKKYSTNYVANIDYGDTTEREHYHAVVLADHIPLDKWIYGFSYVEKVNRYASNEKLACYISKLTNHAIKESVKRCTLIYSRKQKD